MQPYYENWKTSKNAARKLKNRVLDPDGILTGNGFIQGVYEISYYNVNSGVEISAYIGQAGQNPEAPTYFASNVYERTIQHLKCWMGSDYYTYWLGLPDDDNSEWKIYIKLLKEEKDYIKRLELESEYIDEKHPLLQDTQGGKYGLYPSKGYKRNDLCIYPWKGQRRLAFLDRLAAIEKADLCC